jgi:hypothetical protein
VEGIDVTKANDVEPATLFDMSKHPAAITREVVARRVVTSCCLLTNREEGPLERLDLADAVTKLQSGTALYAPISRSSELAASNIFVRLPSETAPWRDGPVLPSVIVTDRRLMLLRDWLDILPTGLEVGFDPEIRVELPGDTIEDLISRAGLIPTVGLGIEVPWSLKNEPFQWPGSVPPDQIPFSFVGRDVCSLSTDCSGRSHKGHFPQHCSYTDCSCPPATV